MSKMTKREKKAARALAVNVAEDDRAWDYMRMAQLSSEGRLVRANGETYVSLKPLTAGLLDTEDIK